jgi:hypothetical protein
MDVSPFPNYPRHTDDHPSPAWSAPSAIGLAGVGVGGQAGAEMTDFLVVLNSPSVGHPPSTHVPF